ncbi:MAG TPA: peptidylprolyl isomerase, partial [bacterium]|nr:peptidylprolyl isomerase [bacterium]
RGRCFSPPELDALSSLLVGNPRYENKSSRDLIFRLRRALTAFEKPEFKSFLEHPLYLSAATMATDWYLARQYCHAKASGKGAPTHQQLQDYYSQYANTYSTKPARRATVLLLPITSVSTSSPVDIHYTTQKNLEKALAIVEKARQGTPLAELARGQGVAGDVSEVTSVWLQEPSFYEADTTLAKMQPGEISDPVRSSNGHYIFQLHETRPSEPIPFDEVRDRVLSDYLWAREIEAWDELLLQAEESLDLKPCESQ